MVAWIDQRVLATPEEDADDAEDWLVVLAARAALLLPVPMRKASVTGVACREAP